MNQEDNNQMSPPPPPPGPGDGEPQNNRLTVPFEDPSKEFVTGLVETVKLVLFKPTEFFKNYNLDGKIQRPMIFAVIVAWIGVIASSVWSLIFNQSMFTLLQDRMGGMDGMNMAASGVGTVMTMIFAPIAIIIGLFIGAGIYHGFLMLYKGATKKFDTTFNVVCYSASAKLFDVLPLCGSLISGIYGLVLTIIGLRDTHETETWKAVMAVLSIIILCCVCCGVVFMAVGGMAGIANMNR